MSTFINSYRFGEGDGQPFVPDPPVDGMQAWYRAGDGVTTTIDGVQSWNDISGNGWHLTSNTPISDISEDPTKAQNGHTPILTTGSTYFVNTTGPVFAKPLTIVALIASHSSSTGFGEEHSWFDSDATYDPYTYIRHNATAGYPTLRMNAGTRLDDNVRQNFLFNWHIVTCYYDSGAASDAYIDGLLELSGNAGTNSGVDGIRICNSWNGWSLEYMLFNKKLSSGERQQAETYLMTRYFPGALIPPPDGVADPAHPTDADCAVLTPYGGYDACRLQELSWDGFYYVYCQCGPIPDVGGIP